jgi:hypothetical protein
MTCWAGSSASCQKSFVKLWAKMNNTSYMKLRALFLILAVAFAGSAGAAEYPLKPDPIQWCHVAKEGVVIRAKAGKKERELTRFARGALLPAYEKKKSGDQTWLRVVFVDLALMSPRAGWLDSADVDAMDAGDFPHDDKILALSSPHPGRGAGAALLHGRRSFAPDSTAGIFQSERAIPSGPCNRLPFQRNEVSDRQP